MKLTRLRLLGFKSFVEPTDFAIEPGLTGVVGPNGCGKSNLVEALRWVMGESSHKSMRAASMDDVIFSGSNTRPARNNAEVAIAIDNSSRSAPAAFNDQDTLGARPRPLAHCSSVPSLTRAMLARRQWQSLAEVILCSGFPTQLVLSGLAALAGIRPLTEAGGLSLPFVALVSAADTVLLLLLVVWFLRIRGETP